jgi:hypothetical protein
MTHDELLRKLKSGPIFFGHSSPNLNALLAVVKLHKPSNGADDLPPCLQCGRMYPCPTIQAIEKELE